MKPKCAAPRFTDRSLLGARPLVWRNGAVLTCARQPQGLGLGRHEQRNDNLWHPLQTLQWHCRTNLFQEYLDSYQNNSAVRYGGNLTFRHLDMFAVI